MPTEVKILTTRLPVDMYQLIEQAAKKDDRSINWVIVSLLEAQLKQAQKKDAIATGTQER